MCCERTDTWIELSAHAANVLRWLESRQKNDAGRHDAESRDEHEQRGTQHSRNVDSHLQPRPAHDIGGTGHGKKIAGG